MPRRPKQQRSRATVDAIVEAGFICVARAGMSGTTTRHVADLAGISVGSFYEYFSNKEALFEAMRERFVLNVAAMIEPLRPELVRMGVIEAVETLLARFGDLLQQNDGRYLKCVRESLQLETAADTAPITKVLVETVMQYVMHHPELMRLRNIPTMSYILIHGGIATVVHHLSDPSPPMSFEALAHGIACLVGYYVAEELRLTAPSPP